MDARRLKILRQQRALTVRELAETAGLSKTTISHAERTGRVHPSTVRKLARALGVEPSELVKVD